MRWRSETTPATVLVVVLALVWTALIARLHVEGRPSPLDRFEEVCLDIRYLLAPGRSPPPDVALVAIDDETVRQAGAYPLPRAALASIIEAVSRQKPKAIAVDLLLLSPGPSAADEALANALRSVPSAIAAAGLFGESGSGTTASAAGGSVPRPARILWPIPAMAAAADVGLVNLSTGFAGIPRHVPLLFQTPDGIAPSLALATAALALGVTPRFADESVDLADRRMALDLAHHLAIRFYGPQGTIPTISGQVVLGPDPPALAGRVVVIGATATGSGDTFPSPFAAVMPGAEVIATAVGNLLASDGLVRTRLIRWLDAGAAVSLTLAAIASISARRTILGLVLVFLLAGVWAAVTLAAFSRGYWLSTSLPIAAMIPTAALCGSLRLWQERRTALRLTRVQHGLRLFNPRPMSDLLARDPLFLATPRIQDAAVLFVDLSGYTTLSETYDPVRMRDLLKSFHALVDATVDRHGGFVVTFMGDGAMILFGFPQSRHDDAARALAALMELEAQLRPWGSAGATGLQTQIRARLSAHHGPVVVSRLGGDTHQQITATGDTVNVASRLLEVAKQNGVSTVVSEQIVRAAGVVGPDQRFSAAVTVPIRGRSQSVSVRLMAAPGQ